MMGLSVRLTVLCGSPSRLSGPCLRRPSPGCGLLFVMRSLTDHKKESTRRLRLVGLGPTTIVAFQVVVALSDPFLGGVSEMNIEAVVGFVGQRFVAFVSGPLATVGVTTNNAEALVAAVSLVAIDMVRAFIRWKRG